MDRCHCGRPVCYGFDGNPEHTRGMCAECDVVRCDAFPQDCPFDNKGRPLTFTCSMCLNAPVAHNGDVCASCRRYRDYYESLTAQERAEEEAMIARHVAESDGL